MNKGVHRLFKDAHEKAITGTYTGRYEMVQQAVARAIYLGGADHQTDNKV